MVTVLKIITPSLNLNLFKSQTNIQDILLKTTLKNNHGFTAGFVTTCF